MTIAAVLQSKGGEVVTVSSEKPVTEALALLAERRIGAVPVIQSDRVAGIFSERDILYGLRSEGVNFLERQVGDVMTAPALTVTPSLSIDEAFALMTRRRIRHLPVLESDAYGAALIGLVSIGDLVKFRIDRAERDADAMRSYIQGS